VTTWRLAAQGVDASGIRFLVVSPLRFDPCGGNHQIPNARLVVRRREWAAGHDADLAEKNFYNPSTMTSAMTCRRWMGSRTSSATAA